MNTYPVDPRRLSGGADSRRPSWTGEDLARLEAVVGQHGGRVETFVVGEAAIGLRWLPGTGQEVTVTAPSAPEALVRLRAAIAGRA